MVEQSAPRSRAPSPRTRSVCSGSASRIAIRVGNRSRNGITSLRGSITAATTANPGARPFARSRDRAEAARFFVAAVGGVGGEVGDLVDQDDDERVPDGRGVGADVPGEPVGAGVHGVGGVLEEADHRLVASSPRSGRTGVGRRGTPSRPWGRPPTAPPARPAPAGSGAGPGTTAPSPSPRPCDPATRTWVATRFSSHGRAVLAAPELQGPQHVEGVAAGRTGDGRRRRRRARGVRRRRRRGPRRRSAAERERQRRAAAAGVRVGSGRPGGRGRRTGPGPSRGRLRGPSSAAPGTRAAGLRRRRRRPAGSGRPRGAAAGCRRCRWR